MSDGGRNAGRACSQQNTAELYEERTVEHTSSAQTRWPGVLAIIFPRPSVPIELEPLLFDRLDTANPGM